MDNFPFSLLMAPELLQSVAFFSRKSVKNCAVYCPVRSGLALSFGKCCLVALGEGGKKLAFYISLYFEYSIKNWPASPRLLSSQSRRRQLSGRLEEKQKHSVQRQKSRPIFFLSGKIRELLFMNSSPAMTR